MEACEAWKQHTIQVINDTRPDVVLIANAYNDRPHDRGAQLAGLTIDAKSSTSS